MKHIALTRSLLGSSALLAVFLAASSLLAQQGATQTGAAPNAALSLNFVLTPTDGTCPVSMHALQGSGGGLEMTRNAPPRDMENAQDRPSQRIHLILSDRQAAKVASAKVVVSGYNGKQHTEQAAFDQSPQATLTKAMTVKFAASENGVAADLPLPGFTAVTSIHLESLTYKDGSTWTVAGQQACRVAPDGMMLVSSR